MNLTASRTAILRPSASLIAVLISAAVLAAGCASQYPSDGYERYDKGYTESGSTAANAPAPPATYRLEPRSPEPLDTSREQFKEYPERDFSLARDDNKSTFAIDVDTASYTIMRRNIQNGQRPDPASVRVEEWVNYFDYGYAAPPMYEQPFAVHMEAAPSPFDPRCQLLRVGLKGFEIEDVERGPVNLVFLVDVSGSMHAANKLPLVQHSLLTLIERLGKHDTVGLVVYAGAAGVVQQPTSCDHNGRSRLRDAIRSLRAGGSTAGGAGLRAAYGLAADIHDDNAQTRVILCTDGDFNVGVRGNELVSMVERYRNLGVYLSVMMFGHGNINDADMEQVANKGDGNYFYIDGSQEAHRVFSEELTSTLQVIAKDVKVQVEFNANVVKGYRLVGYENRALRDEDFRRDYVDAGELGAGHSVTAFYEIDLVDGASRDAELATVHLRYQMPDAKIEDPATEFDRTILAHEIRTDINDTTPSFRFGAAVMQAAQILRCSKRAGEADWETVLALAESAVGSDPHRQEFLRLALKARDLGPIE